MIVDVHNHLWEPGAAYVNKLLATCDELGIQYVCLMGLPEFMRFSPNTEVAAACAAHPDRLLGFAFVDLGRDGPEVVDRYRGQGFIGLKAIAPRVPYDHESCFPVYERAAALGMPFLFHTGIVFRSEQQQRDYPIRCEHMRPIHLDCVAREFPGLTLIAAHMGNPWADEAAAVIRINPNLYTDLTGSTLKWRPFTEIGQFLWWRGTSWGGGQKGPWEKVLFGTDSHVDQMAAAVDDHRRLMAELAVLPEEQSLIWGKTAAQLLGLKA